MIARPPKEFAFTATASARRAGARSLAKISRTPPIAVRIVSVIYAHPSPTVRDAWLGVKLFRFDFKIMLNKNKGS